MFSEVMERALSEKPADLEILRYCCEDEEEVGLGKSIITS